MSDNTKLNKINKGVFIVTGWSIYDVHTERKWIHQFRRTRGKVEQVKL